MSEFSKSLSVSTSGLQAQATRLRHLSENISNADTPGYRRKTMASTRSKSAVCPLMIVRLQGSMTPLIRWPMKAAIMRDPTSIF